MKIFAVKILKCESVRALQDRLEAPTRLVVTKTKATSNPMCLKSPAAKGLRRVR